MLLLLSKSASFKIGVFLIFFGPKIVKLTSKSSEDHILNHYLNSRNLDFSSKGRFACCFIQLLFIEICFCHCKAGMYYTVDFSTRWNKIMKLKKKKIKHIKVYIILESHKIWERYPFSFVVTKWKISSNFCGQAVGSQLLWHVSFSAKPLILKALSVLFVKSYG